MTFINFAMLRAGPKLKTFRAFVQVSCIEVMSIKPSVVEFDYAITHVCVCYPFLL